MYRPGGQATFFCTDGKVEEYDTFTCCHCNGVVHVKAKADPNSIGGFCRMCMKMTCKRCDAAGVCTPFERRLEALEAAYHARRSYV